MAKTSCFLRCVHVCIIQPKGNLLRNWLCQIFIKLFQFVPTLSGGKLLTLQQPAPLSDIIKRVKSHLNLQHLRLAQPPGVEEFLVHTAAACAGSGGSVLQGVRANLLLTGEMSHHQVLDATSRGCAVILCEHSNTERGYLQSVYRSQLEKAFNGQVEVAISTVDRDPLEIV